MSKILIIGSNPLNFTTEIINNLLLKGNKITVYTSCPPNINVDDNLLRKIKVVNIKLPISYLSKIKSLVLGLLHNGFFLLKLISIGKINGFKELYQNCAISIYSKELKEFDIVNFQQISFNSAWLNFFKKNTKVISSFWGSDLLMDDNKESFKQKNAFIKKSTFITMQNLKMADVFFEKYGNYNNVNIILYPLKNEIFKHIIPQKKTNYSNRKINIGVGYNAHKRQNHIKIIKSLSNLNIGLKNRIELKLFFQYGGSKEYKEKVIALTNESQISFNVFTKFLRPEELAEKWNEIDLMIILSVTDAFSASVSENLFAENLLITGNWLPYDLYKKNGVYFEEISSFNELENKLNHILSNFNQIKNNTIGNKEKVLKTLDFNGNLNKWIDLYN